MKPLKEMNRDALTSLRSEVVQSKSKQMRIKREYKIGADGID